MEQREAIALMQKSNNIRQWNANRDIVMNNLVKDNKTHEFIIFLDYKCQKSVVLQSLLPRWFFGTIDGGLLLKQTLKN